MMYALLLPRVASGNDRVAKQHYVLYSNIIYRAIGYVCAPTRSLAS